MFRTPLAALTLAAAVHPVATQPLPSPQGFAERGPRVAAEPPATWGAVQRTVRYEYRLMNPTDRPALDIRVFVPLPATTARQEVHYLHHSSSGLCRVYTNASGQRLAEYYIAELPRGAHRDFGFVAGVTLRSRRYPASPDPDLPDLAPDERARHLAPRRDYSMDDPLMRRKAAELCVAGDDDLTRLTRIHDFVCATIRYDRDGRWDPAARVLQRGTGSCSEYTYLLSGLCRLAGLPTRHAGGTACPGGDLPGTDDVFHRWTEVFLRGIGWYPADCARDADPLLGRRGGLGAVHADVLVWRRGEGGDPHLGWEYRGQRDAGRDPGLGCSHRARWFDFVPEQVLTDAATWLARGAGATPPGDALECSLLLFDTVGHPAQVRGIAALARAGRPAALRFAARLPLPAETRLDFLRSLTSDDLARQLQERGADPWRLHTLWRLLEPRLYAEGGRLALRAAPPEILRGDAGDDAILATLLDRGLDNLRARLLAWRGSRPELVVVCRTDGLDAALRDAITAMLGDTPGIHVADGAAFDAGLGAAGGTPQEYWSWAMRARDAAPDTPLGVAAVVLPSLRREHRGDRPVVTLGFRALHLDRREVISTAVSYAVTP